MDLDTPCLKMTLLRNTFRSERELQLQSLEQTTKFLHSHLLWALAQLRALPLDQLALELDFYETELPLVLDDARKAMESLRRINDPKEHCDT